MAGKQCISYEVEAWDILQYRFKVKMINDHTLHFVAAFSGEIDVEQLKTAVNISASVFPLIKCKFAESERHPHWEDCDYTANEMLSFLDTDAIPLASPRDDGEHRAEFSYKWATIHAGLGFIGKNDVFVHYRYAQRIRISCLLINFDLPVFTGNISRKCGNCNVCVEACPHKFITGYKWHAEVKREELLDYKKCAAKSNHNMKYLCAQCSLSCTYPNNYEPDL